MTRLFWLSYINGQFRMLRGSRIKAELAPADSAPSDKIAWRMAPLSLNQLTALTGAESARRLWRQAGEIAKKRQEDAHGAER